MVNICPVCGYLLKKRPINFHICPSCSTEFGYDDAGRTHAELRANWLREGAQWWSPTTPKPEHWDPYMQLDNLINRPTVWQTVLAGTNRNRTSDLSSLASEISKNNNQAENSPLGLKTMTTGRAA